MMSGAVASALCTVVVSLGARGIGRRPARGTNATSHWVWGDAAADQDPASVRYTAVGYLIHHASSVFWATFYERWLLSRIPLSRRPALAAAAMAGVAYTIDYKVVPRRLTPGFEFHLSRPSILAAYAAFAAGLFLVAATRRR